MSRRKAIRAAYEQGWDGACSLYQHLAEGGQINAEPNSDLLLRPGEDVYADTDLEYARYYAAHWELAQGEPLPPRFTISPLRAIRDVIDFASARRDWAQAQKEVEWRNAPAWHDQCVVRSVLTNRRLLCDVAGEWLSFWYSAILQITVDLRAWSFQLGFESTAPLMLGGPDAPPYALAVAYLTRGEAALRMPEFAPLANRSRMPLY